MAGTSWEAVPHADHGLDRIRLAELAAEPGDGDGHGPREQVGALVPDALEQVLGAADAPVGDQQFLQHAQLLTVERHRVAGPADPPPGPVEHEVTVGDHRGGGWAAPG